MYGNAICFSNSCCKHVLKVRNKGRVNLVQGSRIVPLYRYYYQGAHCIGKTGKLEKK